MTPPPGFEIRLLERADDMGQAVTVLQQVWGTLTPIVNVELLCAVAHCGGYVSAAYEHGKVAGASFAFLARHDGEDALHSHVTGLLPGFQHGGRGRAFKQHQRAWAVERSIPWITWTFDPLIRRNAWFNIEVLRARVAEYLVNFYGTMNDSINANDETDRLLVAWPTTETPADAPGRAPTPATAVREVPTPDDIVLLRRTDPAAALAWRHRVRDEMCRALTAGGKVAGFTREGSYLVALPDHPAAIGRSRTS